MNKENWKIPIRERMRLDSCQKIVAHLKIEWISLCKKHNKSLQLKIKANKFMSFSLKDP